MSDQSNISKIFGKYVFNDYIMQQRLPRKIYAELKGTIERGEELQPYLADVVAHEMKEWAIEKGATHYTHWFQPLTGATAEKHDSFISYPLPTGKVLMNFSGKELIKGEPDASSFPSGGLRNTFEARGYTAWDPTSPAFIRRDDIGATLVIPTAFCSYKGEALDEKTPLLRSMEALNDKALRLLKILGKNDVTRVFPNVGVEQEYFIIDKNTYLKRKDLIYTGRTLFGARAAKGQELDEHYFGVIRPRIGSFMKELNEELWSMGVTAKTQHNEVAPAQHELAVIYAEANLAVDHNQIVMETLKRVAERHGLQCLLHEKPFAKVNGSGKHNNWSLTTNTGENLLDPGDNPHENYSFMLVLSCILRAVDRHAALLRESAADVGNDRRLGADEAPPSIISIFLGEQLRDVVEQFLSKGEATHCLEGRKLDTGVTSIPDFSIDATDRNRTSPFAFTGNKFEFRMIGSRDTVAKANTVLNTIVAESFDDAADFLEGREDIVIAVRELVNKYLSEHKRIIFEGNGYSKEWVEEAEKRGLPNMPTMVDAIEALQYDSTIKMFEKYKVFSKRELESRTEIAYEKYIKAMNIEARASINIATKQLIPAITRYIGELSKVIYYTNKSGVVVDIDSLEQDLKIITSLFKEAKTCLNILQDKVDSATDIKNSKDRAFYYKNVIVPLIDNLRLPIDKLEMLVDKKYWPMPSYGDLLFEV